MSALLRLSALRVQELHLLQTACAGCGHTLKQHALTMAGGTRCRHYEWGPTKRGRLSKTQQFCTCKSWVDPSEQLDLAGNEQDTNQ